jgi:hypothetical protein
MAGSFLFLMFVIVMPPTGIFPLAKEEGGFEGIVHNYS